MEKKHATVLALTFVLVGLMFFSVDTPLVNQQDVEPLIHEAPEIIEQIADEPVPQEPLRLNVAQNPSFEEWDSVDHEPEEWNGISSAYGNGDATYTGSIKNGNYAGLVEAEGSYSGSGFGYLQNQIDDSVYYPFLRHGISLSLNWYVIANPDVTNWGIVYIEVQTQNFTGFARTFYYYLSHQAGGWSNGSSNAYFLLNNTIGSWHLFDRNITDDFIEVFGSSILSDTHYIQRISLTVQSPSAPIGMTQTVYDDVSMYNATFSSWIENGDFETGTEIPWTSYVTSPSTISQSIDSTSGTYSLNLSSVSSVSAVAHASVTQTYSTSFGYHALYPRMNILSWDWQYNDTTDISQYGYLRVAFYNGSWYYLNLYMGRGNDDTPDNSTSTFNVKAPGFGNRGTWQHSEVDLYPITNEIGYYNLTLYSIQFYIYQATASEVELLVDNFMMMTYPTSDPTFEYVENWGVFDPFTGWQRNVGNGEVTQSIEAHGGTYSANITVENGDDGIWRNFLYVEIDPALSTDFWWRLEDLQNTGSAYAWINMEFVVSGTNRVIRYVIGKSSLMSMTDTITHKHIFVEGFNQTGTWINLARNLTADIESAFSTSAVGWSLYSFGVKTSAAAGMRTSVLIDDLHFKDGIPPTVDSVAFLSTQYYYYNGYLQVSASDARPGVSDVTINYTTNGGTSWDTIATTYNSDWYEVDIPAQGYGTTVEFSVIATDGGGLVTIDDNGGAYYSYYVDDNVDPTLTITDPVNNTDQSGLLAITADAFDAGAGVEYVRFNPDGAGAVTDYTAPYSQNWNLDDEPLGSHFIVVTVRDNAGNEVTKTHYITVVDTVAPALDSPDDVEFTVGETGHIIDWNPTDVRPTTYEIFVEEVSTYTGTWNSSSEHLVVELDGLAVGTYNYTCVVYDEVGFSAVDTVMVTVNEVVPTSTTTTTTTTETTTTTDTTSDTTTTSGEPTGGGDLMTPLLIVAGIGVVGILLIVFVVLPKMKK